MKLIKFLVKAKKKGYASNGEGGERILKNGAKELRFKEGDFEYVDTYYGFNPFIGEEIVFENGKFIWGMNYFGKVFNKNTFFAKKVYSFLKKSMILFNKEMPFRGPKNFKEGDFKYTNKTKGNIKKFNGNEIIFYKGKKVYELNYHGSLIKSKF